MVMRNPYLVALGAGLAALAVAGLVLLLVSHSGRNNAGAGSPSSLSLAQRERVAGVDPGVDLHGAPAPDFTLTDQFGQQVSLHQFRGKVVVLAFTDSQCTTICPLTSQSMKEALSLLPASASQQVQLLGLNANPSATSLAEVRQYSIAHGLENKWLFLTGSPAQLAAVWKAYHVYVQIQQGAIDHTPALYVIDRQGGERVLSLTSGQYGVVGDEAFALAAEIAPLLPGHVHVAQQLPTVQQLSPTQPTTLPVVNANGASRTVTLGPGMPHLLFFFTSWSSNIQDELVALNAVATTPGMPQVLAVDIATVEPSSGSLQTMLNGLPTALRYPVAVDRSGSVADAYQVLDMPWVTVVDANGKLVGAHDGWESAAAIEQAARQLVPATP